MKFRLVLDFDPETASYSAVCPESPGCSSAGVTEDEARSNIEAAIRLYLAPVDLTLHDTAKLSEVTMADRGTPDSRYQIPLPPKSKRSESCQHEAHRPLDRWMRDRHLR